MTPQEKGDELIETYWNQIWHNLTPVNYNAKLKDGSNNSLLEQSVKCSIIAVEEIIKQAEITDNVYKSTVWATIDRDEGEPNKHLSVPYWSKVLNYLKSKQ